MLLENERWIEGLEDRYAVNDQGDVISYIKGRISMAGGLGMDRDRRKRTYRMFSYKVAGKQKSLYFHKCVAMAFIPNPENKPFVNHIDGNKQNNKATNLEWVTAAENTQHAWDTGLMQGALDYYENYDPFVKADLHREDVIDIYLQSGVAVFGISDFTIDKHLMSYDFERNRIPPEFEGTTIKNGSYLNEWHFRFAIMSLVENSSYTLTEISKKTKCDLSMISRIKSKSRWQDSWLLYDKYKNDAWYNPLL